MSESKNSKAVAGGTYIGWLVMLSIFVDEWNVFSVPMLSAFIDVTFRFSSFTLGLITGAIVGGAAIGSLLGGFLTDKFGRKKIFAANMIIFIISAFASALSNSLDLFLLLRFVTGIPVDSDLANGYAYIMESLPVKQREVMGTRNTLMASLAITS